MKKYFIPVFILVVSTLGSNAFAVRGGSIERETCDEACQQQQKAQSAKPRLSPAQIEIARRIHEADQLLNAGKPAELCELIGVTLPGELSLNDMIAQLQTQPIVITAVSKNGSCVGLIKR